MFGYIKTYKPEMKICEFDAYKAVYCTICRQLRKDYGILARFTLNYDYTFLAMIRMATAGSSVSVKKGRCPFNPLAKCNHIHCEDASLNFACAVAMMMVYYKWKDTKEDEGFLKKAGAMLLSPLVKHWHKKAVKRYPEIQECMETYYRAQGDIENCSEESLDYYSHPTADVLGKLFSYNMPTQSLSRILYTIGYNVGKWVYLIDALEDYQQDLKKNSFNPYRIRLGEKTTIDQVANFAVTQLNICMDEACMAFDLLPKGNFYPILHNILFLGLDHQVKEIVRKVKTNE